MNPCIEAGPPELLLPRPRHRDLPDSCLRVHTALHRADEALLEHAFHDYWSPREGAVGWAGCAGPGADACRVAAALLFEFGGAHLGWVTGYADVRWGFDRFGKAGETWWWDWVCLGEEMLIEEVVIRWSSGLD